MLTSQLAVNVAAVPTYRVIIGVVSTYKVVTVTQVVMKVVLYCFLRVPSVKAQT